MRRLLLTLPCLLIALLATGNVRAQDESATAERPSPDPGDVEVHTDNIVFHWSSMERAKEYHLQVGKTLLFHPATVDERVPNTQAEIVAGRLPPRLYYWRVSVVTEDGVESPYSTARILNLAPQPTALPSRAPEPRRKGVIIYKPTEPVPEQVYGCRSSVGTTDLTFRWQGKAWRSRVQVASDEVFTHVVKDQTVLKRGTEVKLPAGTFHYRLAQYSARRGWKPVWSEVRRFHVRTDDTPPLLRVATPPSQVFTNNRVITIQGATEADAVLTLNERALDVTGRGEFTHDAALQPGRNELVLLARDTAGNETRHVIVAVLVPEELQRTALARLVALQRQLNNLDALNEDLDVRNEDLLTELIQSDKVSPERAEQHLALKRELKDQRTAKRALDAQVAEVALDMDRSLGVRSPPPPPPARPTRGKR